MENTAPPFFRRGPSLVTRLTFFALLSLILLYSDARFHFLDGVRRVVATVLYPFQQVADLPSGIGQSVSEFFVTQTTLKRENERLKAENFANSGLLQTQQALAAENQHLRALLQMQPTIERRSRVAEILYTARDPFARKIVLDKGGSSGIEQGAAVINANGLVGQVHRLFPWAAEVSLITDREQAIPVQVVRNGMRAVVFGLGYDGALELRFMPVNADIENGDVLVTSGIDGTYPPGIPVATVANIEHNAAYPFARITCIPAAGVGSFRQVLVLGRGQPQLDRPPAAEVSPKQRKSRRAAKE
jgi:rod shape-determining protein MreC